jgi:hypothetical protein
MSNLNTTSLAWTDLLCHFSNRPYLDATAKQSGNLSSFCCLITFALLGLPYTPHTLINQKRHSIEFSTMSFREPASNNYGNLHLAVWNLYIFQMDLHCVCLFLTFNIHRGVSGEHLHITGRWKDGYCLLVFI